mmetsp:Transcript_12429/g.14235  ORF Transcript_12429/g.14235 Transcript_12429/m.14235 type:complete len:115 (+) Transcript_12429:18-362(+)
MKMNKFEKQPSGMIMLNLDQTPNMKGYDPSMKDYNNDNFSFTLKSRDDPFGNHHDGFDPYDFSYKDDKTGKHQMTSPMTRRQKAKEMDKMKESFRNASPNRFNIDLEKLSHCPM